MPEMMAPPSAPLLNMTPPDKSPVPLMEDDIPDVSVPETVMEAISSPVEPLSPEPPTQAWAEHEALLNGFCAALNAKCTKALEETALAMQDRVEKHAHDFYTGALLSQHNVNTAVKAWIEAATAPAQTYQGRASQGATIAVYTPKGYPLTFTLVQTSQEALIEDVIKLFAWIEQAGFKPTPV